MEGIGSRDAPRWTYTVANSSGRVTVTCYAKSRVKNKANFDNVSSVTVLAYNNIFFDKMYIL